MSGVRGSPAVAARGVLAAALGVVGLLPFRAIAAQDTAAVMIVETAVHLRSRPTERSRSRGVLAVGDTLRLVTPDSLRRDFLHVVTASGDTGWVAFPFVGRGGEREPLEAVAPLAEPPTAALAVRVIGLDAPRTAVDPAWPKPRLRRSTFVGEGGAECDADGATGSDWRTNIRKNRADAPLESYAVALEALLDLPFGTGGLATDREQWTDAQAAAIAEYEGIPVTVTGFLAALRPQARNKESTNCQLTGEANTDWHVALAPSYRSPEYLAVVVEPTPRFKARHATWTPGRLREWVGDRRQRADSVRVTGYLFYDPSHANHLRRYRVSMWEVHPVTRIEVFRRGAWADLDDL
jgi:hypothetical protein